MPPPEVMWPEMYCFCPVHPCVRVCVPKYSQHCILQSTWHIFNKLTSVMHYGTEVNTSQFEIKRPKVKGHGGIKYAGNSTFWAC